MTLYTPRHILGDFGPSFESMTAATLWVLCQPDSAKWVIGLSSEASKP
jgi:hypothetical protein